MKKTLENLAKAFAWESQARNRYTIYASVAKKAWYLQIANVFLETAEQEKEHAELLFEMMQEFVEKEWVEMPYIDIETTTMIKFWDTKMNLETAIAGEYEEWADMYPEFAKVAEEEWYPQFAAKIRAIMVAEKHHEERYKKLHDLVKDDLVFKRDEEIYWTCTKCGYVWKWKEPPKVCPLCGHDQWYYVKMNEDF